MVHTPHMFTLGQGQMAAKQDRGDKKNTQQAR